MVLLPQGHYGHDRQIWRCGVVMGSVTISIRGHYLIWDWSIKLPMLLQQMGAVWHSVNALFGLVNSIKKKFSVVLVISGLDDKILKMVATKIRTLVDVIPKADAKMMQTDHPKNRYARVESLAQPKIVLLLRAGWFQNVCEFSRSRREYEYHDCFGYRWSWIKSSGPQDTTCDTGPIVCHSWWRNWIGWFCCYPHPCICW